MGNLIKLFVAIFIAAIFAHFTNPENIDIGMIESMMVIILAHVINIYDKIEESNKE